MSVSETDEQEYDDENVNEEREKVLSALDTAVSKLRLFAMKEVLPSIGASAEQIEEVGKSLDRDSMVILPFLREFTDNYKEKLLAGNVDFFRQLFPPEFAEVEIQPHLLEKGVLFAKVFISIIKDLDEQ